MVNAIRDLELGALEDIDLTGATADDLIQYDGALWTAETLPDRHAGQNSASTGETIEVITNLSMVVVGLLTLDDDAQLLIEGRLAVI